MAEILIDFSDLDVLVLPDEPLKKYTGFSCGGNAKAVLIPKTHESFLAAISRLRDAEERFVVLGLGSNILVSDNGYAGYVVLTKDALHSIERTGDKTVRCGAGVSLNAFCRYCLDHSLAGMEFAYGIPGSFGGAVFMNAGAFGGEIKDVVVQVEALGKDGNIVLLSGGDLCFGYRDSVFHQNRDLIILSATVQLKNGSKQQIHDAMNELMARRREKQPLNYPSCGSTFKRPQGAYASKLIDDCGLRGKQIGGAAVSEKHCGFIVNINNASSAEIVELIDFVKQDVEKKTGFKLECEVEFLGFNRV